MDTSGSPNTPLTHSRSALRHELSRRLLVDIFRGDFQPGDPLKVMKLAARLGTSSTPIREAMVELETLGVVEFVHNRGARVAPFGPRELHEIFDLRRILETEATRSACARIDREPLESLRTATLPLASDCAGAHRLRLATDMDLRLHGLIADQCGNFRLAKEIRRYGILVETVYQIVSGEAAIQQEAMQEHVAILDALLRGDPAASAAAMSRHIDCTAIRAETAMFG